MRIATNVNALNSWRNLSITNNSLSKTLEKLSSGYRINRAADDAAGLAISEKMRGQIAGLNMAVKNAQDSISLIQTAEGAMNEVHAMLKRMEELAVQAANDTNTDEDRAKLQSEMNQLVAEITRIGDTTEFNTKKLLDGNFTGTFHIGANAGQNLSFSVGDMRADALGLAADAVGVYDAGTTNLDVASTSNDVSDLVDGVYSVVVAADGAVTLNDADGNSVGTGALAEGGTSVTINIAAGSAYLVDPLTAGTVTLAISDTDTDTSDGAIVTDAGTISLEVAHSVNISTQADADSAIDTVQAAVNTVSQQRSTLGALQNRLEHTINNLQVAAENLSAAESRIRDVDMAAEMANFTRNQILLQAGTAMLAQANAAPQSVLQLLG